MDTTATPHPTHVFMPRNDRCFFCDVPQNCTMSALRCTIVTRRNGEPIVLPAFEEVTF